MNFELILPFLRPIEPLLLDESVSEIMGNPNATWWFERDGVVCPEASVQFDANKLRTGLEVIANHLGKRLDEDNPLLHAQLPDGSRIAAVIPPVVRPAPALTIRKFTSRRFTVDDLIARGTLSQSLADFLSTQIREGKTILISGGTGTGKTTLLNVLAQAIPDEERIVVIEDTAELRIQKPNILAAECQTDTFKARISFDDLLKSALRWRPDRIILGEVRGTEARTLLDSFNTGHAGSLATIHANSAEKALHRFSNLVMRSHTQTTFSDTEAEIGEAVDFVVHIERKPGYRIVREVLAIHGYDRDAKCFVIDPVLEANHVASKPNRYPDRDRFPEPIVCHFGDDSDRSSPHFADHNRPANRDVGTGASAPISRLAGARKRDWSERVYSRESTCLRQPKADQRMHRRSSAFVS
jgi:pilus assembly protein CpaF